MIYHTLPSEIAPAALVPPSVLSTGKRTLRRGRNLAFAYKKCFKKFFLEGVRGFEHDRLRWRIKGVRKGRKQGVSGGHYCVHTRDDYVFDRLYLFCKNGSPHINPTHINTNLSMQLKKFIHKALNIYS